MSRMTQRLFALTCAAATLGACHESQKPVPVRQSTAQTLGIYSTDLIDDPRQQALAALAADARRRETRFYNAAHPGFLFGTTRVPQDEIDAGLWTPAELYQIGAQLFNYRFRTEEGFGGKDLPASAVGASRLGRFEKGQRGGPETYQCADCHRGGGLAGAGDASDNVYLYGDGVHQEKGIERNPLSLAGAGLLEILAAEMSRDLAAQRDALLAQAADSGAPARGELRTKQVGFGYLTALPDGSISYKELQGVDHDLVIKPFGWKGHTATLRDMIENELNVHHGMQTEWLAANGPAERVGPFGSPDPDGDGVVGEISEGQLTALTLFAAMQEVPVSEPPVKLRNPIGTLVDIMPAWRDGVPAFENIGCADCHIRSLPLDSTHYVLPSRTGGKPIDVDLAAEGAKPRLKRDAEGRFRVQLFSDLKRHDVGDELVQSEHQADANPHKQISARMFLTAPLWGVARTGPYLHDGHAPSLEQAILHHGGEAEAARKKFEALDDAGRAPIRVYLMSLTRARRFASP